MNAKIISISSTKGGTGKTTLAAGLASYYFRKGVDICVLDVDPNENLSRWIEGNPNGHLINLQRVPNPEDLVDLTLSCAEKHEITIIDCAGFHSQSTLYAASVSDLVLIPARPSEDDVLEAIKTRQIIRTAAKMGKREVRHLVVLNAVQRGTLALRHARARLAAFDMPVAVCDLRSSVNIATVRFSCLSPLDMSPWNVDLPELVAEIEG